MNTEYLVGYKIATNVSGIAVRWGLKELLPHDSTKLISSSIAVFGTTATLAAIKCYRQLIFVKMECNKETFEIFAKNRCGMVMMDGKEKQVYDTPKGDVLFFYPSRNKMTLNKVVGRNKEMNMPIVQTEINEKEWEIKDNSELSAVLSCL